MILTNTETSEPQVFCKEWTSFAPEHEKAEYFPSKDAEKPAFFVKGGLSWLGVVRR